MWRALLILTLLAGNTYAQDAHPTPATRPTGKLPHLTVDMAARRVSVACESLAVDVPLEFFLVANGTNEHESALRSAVKASDLHLALVMLGLEPGQPVRYSEAARKWLPPHGPPLRMNVEYVRNGRTVSAPAYSWLRDVHTGKPMPPLTWTFTGSRVMEDGTYAADVTGYLVSLVNFDLTVIDVPMLASNANETLLWEINPDLVPPKGTPVTLVIEPAGAAEPPAAPAANATTIDMPLVLVDAEGNVTLDGRAVSTADLKSQLSAMRGERPVKVRLSSAAEVPAEVLSAIEATGVEVERMEPTARSAERLSDVAADDQMIARLRERWDRAVAPQGAALRDAAQTHYEVIGALRREQQRIIDEADKIQRLIDELEQRYQDLTTPRPATP